MKERNKFMQAAIVIAGFPGVGKSELFKKGIDGFKIYDSDSSKYKLDLG